MTNPGWAYNDKTATRIKAFARKGAIFTWSDVTYDPKAKTKAYAPARPEPVLTAAQAAWVVDAPRLIKKRK